MTQSLYIVGGAGTGKSTFTQDLLDRLGMPMGPLVDLHKTPNARGTIVTLRGHEMNRRHFPGLYIGCMRENYPGTDGLDRASSITGEAWLDAGGASEYRFILAEGATLATRRFLNALKRHTDLLLIHLYAEDFIKDLRFLQRGSNQDPGFIQATATRSANIVEEMKTEVQTADIDTADPEAWEWALNLSLNHLE